MTRAAHPTMARRELLRSVVGVGAAAGVRAALGASVTAGASAAVAFGCKRGGRRAPTTTRATTPTVDSSAATALRWTELRFPRSTTQPNEQLALVLAARDRPLLVALHGRGESLRGLEAGARGWRDDYELERADRRLRTPPLVADDLLGMVRTERLEALNTSLGAHPYEGLCVACPFTPDLPDRSIAGARPFAAFVVEQLVPRVRRELGCAADRTRTGIDGVSLGGRYALLVGLSHPELFGTVGALQPAIRESEAEELTDLARRAVQGGLAHLRLVTSEEDYFRPAVERLSATLREGGVAHELLVTPGPHDYVYNRGPGSFEMLLWHERVLRGLAGP